MAEDPTSVGEHNLFGFKYTIPEEDNPSEAIITAAGEDTTIEYTFSNGSQSATLNVDKNQSGIDPSIINEGIETMSNNLSAVGSRIFPSSEV